MRRARAASDSRRSRKARWFARPVRGSVRARATSRSCARAFATARPTRSAWAARPLGAVRVGPDAPRASPTTRPSTRTGATARPGRGGPSGMRSPGRIPGPAAAITTASSPWMRATAAVSTPSALAASRAVSAATSARSAPRRDGRRDPRQAGALRLGVAPLGDVARVDAHLHQAAGRRRAPATPSSPSTPSRRGGGACGAAPPRRGRPRRAAAKASRSATWQRSRALVPGIRSGSWPRMWRAAPEANRTVPSGAMRASRSRLPSVSSRRPAAASSASRRRRLARQHRPRPRHQLGGRRRPRTTSANPAAERVGHGVGAPGGVDHQHDRRRRRGSPSASRASSARPPAHTSRSHPPRRSSASARSGSTP